MQDNTLDFKSFIKDRLKANGISIYAFSKLVTFCRPETVSRWLYGICDSSPRAEMIQEMLNLLGVTLSADRPLPANVQALVGTHAAVEEEPAPKKKAAKKAPKKKAARGRGKGGVSASARRR